MRSDRILEVSVSPSKEPVPLSVDNPFISVENNVKIKRVGEKLVILKDTKIEKFVFK